MHQPSRLASPQISLAFGLILLSSAAANAQNAPPPAQNPPPGAPAGAASAVTIPSPPSADTVGVLPTVPAEGRLTLDQALAIGMQNNPQATAATYSVVSAHENLNSQRAPINPTLQYAGLNNTVAPADVASGFGKLYNYSAYATIETNGAQHWRTAQAREQFHQAQADADTTRQTLHQDIVNAYIGVQVANRALEVERDVYENSRQLASLTAQRYALGAAPQADAIRAGVAAVQEQQNLLTDLANVRTARATLASALGRSTDTPLDVTEPLTYKPVAAPSVEVLQGIAAANRPEIRSAEANLASLKAAVGLNHSSYFPNVIVGRDLSAGSDVGLGISVPIDLGSIRGLVKKAKADVKTQEAQTESTRQSVMLDVQSSYINLMSAQRQVDSYEGGILHQSETLLRQTRQGYSLGASTILDVITAEETYRAVLSAYYAAIGTYQQAVHQLEHAIGMPLKQDTSNAPGNGGTSTKTP